MRTMTDRVELKCRVDKRFRKQFNNISTIEECTYEELLEELIEFREEHKSEWKAFRRGPNGRRPAGSGEMET